MQVTAKAPVNIALVKYFGKKDPIKVLPYTPSVSLTLNDFYTKTSLIRKEEPGVIFTINGILQSEAEHHKVIDFLRYFEGFIPSDGLIIESTNTIPTAAGFASSASGYAALSVAANAYFKTNYNLETLVKIARMGSGSSVRSLIGGAVLWDTDGMIYPLKANLARYNMMFVVLDDKVKPISSRKAMARVVKTSSLFEYFVSKSFEDKTMIIEALAQDRFEIIGKILESNALLMHATTQTAQPPFTYLIDATYKVLEVIYELRQSGLLVYATMDAGPNVKLLYQKEDEGTIKEALLSHGFSKLLVSTLTAEGAKIIHV